LDELFRLPGATLADTVAITGADPQARHPVTGYQRLTDLDVIEGRGVAVYLRGASVVLTYVEARALPPGLDSDALAAAAGADGEILRSRQGKRASMHLLAGRGLAWSEMDGHIGFIELFPPTTTRDYRDRIYTEPAPFHR
jgi:hypothetical protein